jgi:hypothetical protein
MVTKRKVNNLKVHTLCSSTVHSMHPLWRCLLLSPCHNLAVRRCQLATTSCDAALLSHDTRLSSPSAGQHYGQDAFAGGALVAGSANVSHRGCRG